MRFRHFFFFDLSFSFFFFLFFLSFVLFCPERNCGLCETSSLCTFPSGSHSSLTAFFSFFLFSYNFFLFFLFAFSDCFSTFILFTLFPRIRFLFYLPNELVFFFFAFFPFELGREIFVLLLNFHYLHVFCFLLAKVVLCFRILIFFFNYHTFSSH